MDILASLGFGIAALCAAAMGFAIQRGATCMVVAVNEIIERRKASRLLAMIEASLWVAGGLLVARALGLAGPMPAGFAPTGWTVLGGALLGAGAFINGACVFGAVARLGSGDWAYVATPLGFYLGCVSFPHLVAPPDLHRLPFGSPVLQAPSWVALVFVVFAAWRLAAHPLAARRRAAASGTAGLRDIADAAWSPHAATTVIGITFVVMLLLVGAWSYTEALSDLARDMAGGLGRRMALLGALLLGAVLGGYTAGRLSARKPSVRQVLRCGLGGAMMAWGGMLVPGSNDGLILLGMPLLWPHAWLAFATMGGAIAASRLLGAAIRPAARAATGG